ncbi:MAG: hypothetical protein U9N49_08485 [Campylobacterota bacterium]|nr:hypothetical protein [Campylobacterota bacterium]
MKILEDWGIAKVNYFYRWFAKNQTKHYDRIDTLFHAKIIYLPIFLAFVIGFVFTLPIIFFELLLDVFNQPTLQSVTIYLLVTTASVFLEFYFLFLLGFITLAYYIHHLYLIDEEHWHISQEEFVATLVRSVMELPEKKIINYNLNPYEYQETRIILLSLIYKAKVILTNMIAKFIVKKALSRSSLRIYSAYVAALVTGIWDALIFLKTIRESRYKIMIRFMILYLVEHKKELLLEDQSIKIILFRYYYFGEYNNNFDRLLQEIYSLKAFEYEKDIYLNSSPSNSKLLALLFAFKFRTFSSKERAIMQEFDILQEVKTLRKMIKKSNIKSLQEYINTL